MERVLSLCNFCYILLFVECALVLWDFVLYIFCVTVKWALGLCNSVLYFSTIGIRYGIVECCIFLHVDPILVLWSFMLQFSSCEKRFGIVENVLYFSACETCSSFVKFCGIFFFV